MFNHNVTVENEMYKVEFLYNGIEVKTVYVNSLTAESSMQVIDEIEKLYNTDHSKFIAKMNKFNKG